MLNRFAKFLLVLSSLSPMLGAVAVNQFAIGKPLLGWLPWVNCFIAGGHLLGSAAFRRKERTDSQAKD